MNHQLTKAQLFLINVSFITGSSLLMAPGLTTAFAKNDAWLAMILAVFLGVLLNFLFLLCLRKFNYASIFEIVEKSAGPYLGPFINILIIFYALHLAAYVVRNLSNFMITVISPEASSSIFQVSIIFISLYSVYFGSNNLARVNQFFGPISLLLLIGSLFLVANQFHFSNLKPILTHGLEPIWNGAYPTIGFPFIEIILVASLLNFVHPKKKLMRTYLFSLLFGGVVLVILVLFSIGIQGYDLIIRQTYSTFELMKDINIIELLERVEVLVAIAWIFGIFVKITICFLAAMLGFQHISRHSSYRPFLLPAGVFVWVLSKGIHPDTVSFFAFVSKFWTVWWFVLYFILICLMIIGMLFQQKNKQG
jgi:spore germination protein (amino acid permease)